MLCVANRRYLPICQNVYQNVTSEKVKIAVIKNMLMEKHTWSREREHNVNHCAQLLP